jgi:hypothetical protein
MALFAPDITTCALCGEVLAEADDMVGTSHFIGDRDHPLFAYSDALMHRACFLTWEHRVAFVAAYNAEMGRDNHMRADGTIRERFLFWFPRAVLDKVAALESWFRRRPG